MKKIIVMLALLFTSKEALAWTSSPSVAPDMSPGYDSGVHDDDDVTASVRPMFSVPCVNGDTLRFYVDGIYNTYTNCTSDGDVNMVPISDLSAGVHDITYTWVNAAPPSESAHSPALTVTIDTDGPNLSEVTPVATPTNDSTPNYTFSSDESGDITYSGDCSSSTTTAIVGDNNITFDALGDGTPLGDGTHSNCAIEVEDLAGNSSGNLNVSSFIVDTVAPTVGTITITPSAPYGLNLLISGLSEISAPVSDAGSGLNTVTCAYAVDGGSSSMIVVPGAYDSDSGKCIFSDIDTSVATGIAVTIDDLAGNFFDTTYSWVGDLVVDATAPNLSEVTPVATPTNDSTPNYTFSSDESGDITYSGDCSSSTTTAIVGDNNITFDALGDGVHSNCTITVTDQIGNENTLNVTSFTVDAAAPNLSEVTPVVSPTSDSTPSYTFSSSEAGSITYDGGCSSPTVSAVSGNNTVTFNHLSDGTYNCTVKVTDGMGNESSVLNMSSFTVNTEYGNSESGLPTENDIFWDVMDQIQRPDDADCEAEANDIFQNNGIPTDGNRAEMTCASVAQIMQMEDALNGDGVQTNLFDFADWHHITGLYFQDEFGKIEFTNEIDFMSYEFMIFLQTIMERMEMESGQIELDADIVDGLRNSGAIITMYNVPDFNEVKILVNGDEDSGGVVSNIVYDKVNKTITFNAAHFTTFKAAEKSVPADDEDDNEEDPKITKVKYEKIKNIAGQEIIKMTITGKHFKKKTKVTLGGRSASKVSYKNSKKIVATFKVEKLQNIKKTDLKLKAFNGKQYGKYSKRFILNDLLK